MAGAIEDRVQAVLAALERHASPKIRDEMAPRYGLVVDKAMGVAMNRMQAVAKPLTPAFPETFDAMMAATFMALPPADAGGDAWSEAQTQGGLWGQLPAGVTVAARLSSPSELVVPFKAQRRAKAPARPPTIWAAM